MRQVCSQLMSFLVEKRVTAFVCFSHSTCCFDFEQLAASFFISFDNSKGPLGEQFFNTED